MPTAATVSGTAGGTGAATSKQASNPVGVVPFIRASQLHRESTGIDVSKQIITSDQDLGVSDVYAYGYLRSLFLVVTTSGGAGASVTAGEDAPFSALKNIQLAEPNGATIVQFNSGYELYLANKFGGYRYYNDSRQNPTYSQIAAGTGNFAFTLRVPVELNTRDALGSLPNQNAAATFKLKMTLTSGAANAGIYGGTIPTTQPTVRVRGYLEAWDQPNLTTGNVPNETTPPAMNTTQYWSVQAYAVASGTNTIRLTRMGNYIRNFIFILRRSSSTRANGDSDWPDPLTIYRDTQPLDVIQKDNWLNQIYERYGYSGTADAAGARENGVYPYDFCHEFSGRVGFENRDLWLETLTSTRFELQGSAGNAGTLTVLTNDVSTVGNVFM